MLSAQRNNSQLESAGANGGERTTDGLYGTAQYNPGENVWWERDAIGLERKIKGDNLGYKDLLEEK